MTGPAARAWPGAQKTDPVAATPEGRIRDVLANAELLCSEEDVCEALDEVAAQVAERLAGENPLVLAVMTGGMVPTTWLMQRLSFPVELDYVHATRYRGGTVGLELDWLVRPRADLRGRCVLIVDDILDEGVTLDAIAEHCRAAGARAVYTCVLVTKEHDRARAMDSADFCALTVPDRYVFGCGMDYHGYLRNLPAIYAVGGE